MARRVEFLKAYQSGRYARRYQRRELRDDARSSEIQRQRAAEVVQGLVGVALQRDLHDHRLQRSWKVA